MAHCKAEAYLSDSLQYISPPHCMPARDKNCYVEIKTAFGYYKLLHFRCLFQSVNAL